MPINLLKLPRLVGVLEVLQPNTLALKEILTEKLGNDYRSDTIIDLRCQKDGKFLHRLECI
ncbi:Protein CBG11246 [Caenorhabditis briggsae]|uniref:Protein CBG11246 n=1 Tax=Caenorhabditis briggsae TaxID=6238 RepID=A8XDG0_CAEBR|nr:Protein CBG11246 [Caenorhabditis briggsae]CAP30679.2 Protein CBG11246 [Caenorhabditis briggsae]